MAYFLNIKEYKNLWQGATDDDDDDDDDDVT
jgi:hypothetical protein